jgi:DNA-directed RNA polymerase subunit N (RpoN/RPB10)
VDTDGVAVKASDGGGLHRVIDDYEGTRRWCCRRRMGRRAWEDDTV